MNISNIHIGSNLGSNQGSKSIFVGRLPMAQNNYGLKSTQDKINRQQKASSQIEFWENQKENLKNMKCETLEEIMRKLDMFHSYEDEIAAVKEAYNNEQMRCAMDEARELGEKIAEAAEKIEPKTPEERREEAIEEALGIEKGELSEILDEIIETAEEVLEEAAEQNPEETDFAEAETGKLISAEEAEKQAEEQGVMSKARDVREALETMKFDAQKKKYRHIDLWV